MNTEYSGKGAKKILKPVSTIRSKTVTSPDKVHNTNILTTDRKSAQIQKTRESLQQAKKENSLKTMEIAQNKIDRIAKAMDNYIRSTDKDLKIKVHNETGQIMVKVISGEDGKVIREIPSEELLNLAAKVEEMTGVLFNTST